MDPQAKPPRAPTGLTLALALVSAVVQSACGGGERPDASGGGDAPGDTIVAAVVATIGSTDISGTDEYILGDVRSVAGDVDGHIYIADRLPSSVRVYGPEGDFIAWVGREGEGPGDFMDWPSDILFDEGRLYVRDQRVTAFEPSYGSTYPDSVVAVWQTPVYSGLGSARARFDADIYYYPDYTFRRDEPARYYYLKFGPDGFVGDTVHVPAFANLTGQRTAFYMVSQGSGRLVDGLAVAPFATRAAWDMTGQGTIVAGDGNEYRLQEYDQDGRVLRTFDGPPTGRRPVPGPERADSIAALDARIDSLPVPLSEVQYVASEIVRGEIPDLLPHFLSIHVGASDRIWVWRWPPEGLAESRYYDVIEYDGRYTGTVVVPAPLIADPPPYFGDDYVVGVIMDPVTDVHSVVVARFELPPAPTT